MHFRLLLFSLFISLFPFYFSSAQINPGNSGISGEEWKMSRMVVSLNGGLGYLTGNTKTAKANMRNMGVSESDIDQYFREYKTGGIGGASVHYIVNRSLGVGIDYNLFTTRGQVKGYLDPGDGWTKYYIGG